MKDIINNSTDEINFNFDTPEKLQLIRRSWITSQIFGLFSLLFPLMSTIGWIFDIPLLTQGHPALPAMVPNTALILVLSAIAAFFSQKKSYSLKQSLFVCFIALIISVFGALILYQYAFNLDIGIDKLFIRTDSKTIQPFPGRPAPQTALNFLLYGIALLLFNLPFTTAYLGQICTLIIGANSLVAATGYIFSTHQFYGFPLYIPAVGMAIHTSLGFLFLSGALLFSRPTEGMMTLLMNDTQSSGIARRILLSTVVLPPLIGALTKVGVIYGWYDINFQTSLFIVVIFGLIIRTTWKTIKKAEQEELRALLAFKKTSYANKRLQQVADERAIFAALIENSSDFIGIADTNGKPTYVNQAGRRMIGLAADFPIEKTKIPEYYTVKQREFASNVIVKSMIENGKWKGETYFRNWQTDEPIPVSDEHFMIHDPQSHRVLGMGTITRDISERIHLEKELRLAEARASGIISISEDAIVSIDESHSITIFNEGAEKIFGYKKSEVIGVSLDILIPDRFHAIHRQHIENFANGKAATLRKGTRGTAIIGLRKNGEEFPADATISKFEIEGKRILTVVLRDITVQKRIEYEQKFLADVGMVLASSLDYEETLKNIADLSVRDFADLCIVDIVDEKGKAQRLQTVSRDITKRWICNILSQIKNDSKRPHVIATDLELKRSISLEDLSPDLLLSISQSRERLRILQSSDLKGIVVVPLKAHDKIIGTIALLFSTISPSLGIAELRLTDELATRASLAIENARLYQEANRVKLIADNLPAMMAYWDKDHRCRFANQAYIDWFGFRPEQLKESTLLELFGPEQYEINLPYIHGALNGIRQDFERDLKIPLDNSVRHTNTTYIPEIVDGKVLGFFVLVFDITELKKAQLAAISEKEKALAAVKTREDILAFVSHDLKSPLATIDITTQILRKLNTIEISQLHNFVNRIHRSVDKMQTLINDLLEFGKIQSGTFSIKKLNENPTEIILNAIENFRTLAEAKHHQLEIEISPNLPEIACDAKRINQVLSNLLGNAIKFTPEGGSIRIIATLEKDGVLISVSDTGPGIPSEQLQKVFDRFWQATETKHLGSGLGLSIAKGIIEAHDGKIWAESQIGRGSCFSFIIPLASHHRIVQSLQI